METIITLREIYRQQRYCIAVYFTYDPALTGLCKSNKLQWSYTYRCWWIVNKPANYFKIREIFAGFTIDDSELKKQYAERNLNKREGTDAGLQPLNDTADAHLQKVLRYMVSKRYGQKTVVTYQGMLTRWFNFYSDMDPVDLTADDVNRYNRDFIILNKYSVSYQNQLISAIKLFFKVCVGQTVELHNLVRPRKSQTLPKVLSFDEVKKVIALTANIKHRTLIMTLYSAGLRRSELVDLRIQDIHSDRGVIVILSSKGMKDREVPLSKELLIQLRKYFKLYRPKHFLFEGSGGEKYSHTSVRKIVEQAALRAGINRVVTPHMLRHSFATHMLEMRVNLRYIQTILGHKSSKTTEIYTHVNPGYYRTLANPLDAMGPDIQEPRTVYQKSAPVHLF